MIFCEMFMSFSSTLIAMSIPGEILVLLPGIFVIIAPNIPRDIITFLESARHTDTDIHPHGRMGRRTDRRTDVPTFIFFLDILHVKKYQIIQQVPNNTLYFYGLNRIFNVCSFP